MTFLKRREVKERGIGSKDDVRTMHSNVQSLRARSCPPQRRYVTNCNPKSSPFVFNDSHYFVGEVANFYHQPASKSLRKEIRLVLPETLIFHFCKRFFQKIGSFGGQNTVFPLFAVKIIFCIMVFIFNSIRNLRGPGKEVKRE